MKNPLLVTAAIIIYENKVLLVKRAKEPFKGYWSFIGGCGEFQHASDPEEVIKREVYNEIKCVFSPTFFTYSYKEYEKYDLKSVVLYFRGPIHGIPMINPEYDYEWKWTAFEEAINMELAFDHRAVLWKFLHDFSFL